MLSSEVIKHLESQSHAVHARSLWLTSGEVNVYLRAGPYVYRDGVCYLAVGVSNVNVNADARGKKHFTRFLEELEERVHFIGLYPVIRVEQVHGEQHRAFLERHGYTLLAACPGEYTYEKWL